MSTTTDEQTALAAIEADWNLAAEPWNSQALAGVYAEDPAEVERFLDRIEAGVTYVNRRAGARKRSRASTCTSGTWK